MLDSYTGEPLFQNAHTLTPFIWAKCISQRSNVSVPKPTIFLNEKHNLILCNSIKWIQNEKAGLPKNTNWTSRKTLKGKRLKTADAEIGKTTIHTT